MEGRIPIRPTFIYPQCSLSIPHCDYIQDKP